MFDMFANTGKTSLINLLLGNFAQDADSVRKVTSDFTVPFKDLSIGAKHFVTQRIARSNEMAQYLSTLGVQAGPLFNGGYKDFLNYIRATLDAWNAEIKGDTEFAALIEKLEAEENNEEDQAA